MKFIFILFIEELNLFLNLHPQIHNIITYVKKKIKKKNKIKRMRERRETLNMNPVKNIIFQFTRNSKI